MKLDRFHFVSRSVSAMYMITCYNDTNECQIRYFLYSIETNEKNRRKKSFWIYARVQGQAFFYTILFISIFTHKILLKYSRE